MCAATKTTNERTATITSQRTEGIFQAAPADVAPSHLQNSTTLAGHSESFDHSKSLLPIHMPSMLAD